MGLSDSRMNENSTLWRPCFLLVQLGALKIIIHPWLIQLHRFFCSLTDFNGESLAGFLLLDPSSSSASPTPNLSGEEVIL